MTSAIRSTTPIAWAVVGALVVSVVALPVAADQIITADDNFRRVKVAGFERGELRFRTPDRQVHKVRITEVLRLVVDSVPGLNDLNDAEEYVVNDTPDRAIPRYERALRVADDYWPDLIRVRLLQARDRAGRFARAVADFIVVAESMPQLATELIPQSVPESANADTREALTRIDAARRGKSGTVTDAALLLCRYAICRKVDKAEARRMASDVVMLPLPQGMVLPGEAGYTLQAEAMGLLLESRQYDAVVTGADRVIPDAPKTILPTLLLLKGKAQYHRADDEKGHIRAGWSFMRIVIHYSDDVRAGEALLWAARVHEKIQRPTKAARLLRECLSRTDLSGDLRDDAEDMLDRLEGGEDLVSYERRGANVSRLAAARQGSAPR